MPIVVIIAGPNGSGKTTASRILLQGPLRVDAFVNADLIAQGLAGQSTEEVAFAAGRIMLNRLDELAIAEANFAFEMTLASKMFADRMTKYRSNGYIFVLLFLWLPSPADSINRAQERVLRGGHHVPDDIIRRRHGRGFRNFFDLYRPIANVWRFYNNTSPGGPRLVASGVRDTEIVHDRTTWLMVSEEVQSDTSK